MPFSKFLVNFVIAIKIVLFSVVFHHFELFPVDCSHFNLIVTSIYPYLT